jgi:hypothetical protein
MPIGRRLFQPAEYKAPPIDAFSAAEMAAAVEAVDAMDDNGGAGFDEVPAAAGTGDRQAGGQSDLMGAADATGADDSIALRIALMAGAVELEAAEQEAARFVDVESADEASADEASAREASAREASEDSFEAAEAMAGAANFLPVESGSDRTVVPSAGAIVESSDTASIDLVDADAAEAAAVAEAISEITGTAEEEEPEPAPTRKQFRPIVGGEQSEENAEAQALREAMAFVLEADGRAARAEAESSPEDSDEPLESAQPVESVGHSEAASPQEPAESSEPPESEAGPEQSTRKRGLFHRIRGS